MGEEDLLDRTGRGHMILGVGGLKLGDVADSARQLLSRVAMDREALQRFGPSGPKVAKIRWPPGGRLLRSVAM
jgi:hypothetical protein